MCIVITGANRGVGRALLEHYRGAETEVVGTCRGAEPDDGEWLQLDVADPDSVARLAKALDGRAVDLLICNAGVNLDKGMKLVNGYPPEMWAKVFAVNVTGVFLTVQALMPHLQMADGAKVAIISSAMGSSEKASGGAYAYRASKAAATNLGRNLACDLAELGIAVGIYHPGWVRTDMGGQGAHLSPEEAAAGLADRIAELDLADTGVVQNWDGAALPY